MKSERLSSSRPSWPPKSSRRSTGDGLSVRAAHNRTHWAWGLASDNGDYVYFYALSLSLATDSLFPKNGPEDDQWSTGPKGRNSNSYLWLLWPPPLPLE